MAFMNFTPGTRRTVHYKEHMYLANDCELSIAKLNFDSFLYERYVWNCQIIENLGTRAHSQEQNSCFSAILTTKISVWKYELTIIGRRQPVMKIRLLAVSDHTGYSDFNVSTKFIFTNTVKTGWFKRFSFVFWVDTVSREPFENAVMDKVQYWRDLLEVRRAVK